MALFGRIGFAGLSFFILILMGTPLLAGSSLKTNIDGRPFKWGSQVTFHPESGALKPGVINHSESVELVRDALEQWANVPGVDLQIFTGDTLPDGGNTDSSNYATFYKADAWDCYDDNPSTPCYNPIIFDEDGSILEDLFGECTQFSVLGFSGFTDVAGDSQHPSWTQLKRGQAIFSGACIAPAISKPGCPPCNVVLQPEEVKTLVLHEMGHFLGLGHSQVNPDSYLDCHNGGGCDSNNSEHLPTMFPLLIPGANMISLHQDDKVAIQRLYGDPGAGRCEIKGSVLASDGKSPLRGVEVVARNTDPYRSFTDAVSMISGELAPKITAKGKGVNNCIENCGDFTLSGLEDGETYQLCVQRILEDFTGTKFVGPVDPPFQGVDHDCPEAMEFTCSCSGGECDSWQGVKLVTSNQGLDFAYAVNENAPVAASGCSLIHRRVPTRMWARMSRVWWRFFS